MRRWIMWGLVAATFVVFYLSLGRGSGPHPLLGKPAPEITLPLLDGGTLDLAAHRDKDIVVLDFWATWCPPCRESLPEIAALAKHYEGREVVVYAVSVDQDPEAAGAFLDEQQIDVTVALDPEYQAAWAYEANAIPQTVVIGKDGIVQAVHVGASRGFATALRLEIDSLLAGRSLVRAAAPE